MRHIRHSTLLENLAQLDIPDNVYNWMVDFFNGHSHCTQYRGQISSLHQITASVIQGSSIRPATYVVNAADLKTITPGNEMDKFADDSYIIIPAVNSNIRLAEIEHAANWAEKNNVKVNPAKYKEVVFYDKRRKENAQPPPPLPGTETVTTVKILGVTITNSLSVAEHVHSTISPCAQTLYALRVLRSNGMNDPALQTVFRTVVISKLQYASSAWWGFSTVAERQRIDAFIRRCARCIGLFHLIFLYVNL